MKAIILAAGSGTRLKRYTKNLPKGMLEFNGKSLIEHQIDTYKAQGIHDIVVVTGFAHEQINIDGVKIYHNAEYDSTNMVESLMKAKQEFDEDIIVSYSDIIFSEDLLSTLIQEEDAVSVSVDIAWEKYWQARYGTQNFDTESLKLSKEQKILSLGVEDVPPEEIDARFVGIMKFSRSTLTDMVKIYENARLNQGPEEGWKHSGKPVKKSYMTDLLQAFIDEGYEVHASLVKNGWLEFDTNEDYELARQWLQDKTIQRFINLKQ